MKRDKKGKGAAQNGGLLAAVPQRSFGDRLLKDFKGNWSLYLMVLIPVTYLIIFCYIPMTGIQLAFKEYRVSDGIWGSRGLGFIISNVFSKVINL